MPKTELRFEITVSYQPISFFLHLKMLASSTQMKRLEISIFKPRFVPNRPQTSIYLFFFWEKLKNFGQIVFLTGPPLHLIQTKWQFLTQTKRLWIRQRGNYFGPLTNFFQFFTKVEREKLSSFLAFASIRRLPLPSKR